MSGRGNCFDNAPMESFWGTLKQELIHHRRYRSRQEAMRDITEYITPTSSVVQIRASSVGVKETIESCRLPQDGVELAYRSHRLTLAIPVR